MLDEKRIQEAEHNVKNYLSEGLLRKTNDPIALSILVKNAQESLKASKLLLDNTIPLWAIVSSYYAMCSKIVNFWHARNYKFLSVLYFKCSSVITRL